VLGSLKNEVCYTKILFVFFGTKSYGNKCITEELLRETIGGMWNGGASEASKRLIETVKKIKTAISTSFKFPERFTFKFPERFTHLERIVQELEKEPFLANSMRKRNKHKIETYTNELDKLEEQMEEKRHELKLMATKEMLKYIRTRYSIYRRHQLNITTKLRHQLNITTKLRECLLEKGVGACQALEKSFSRRISYYSHKFQQLLKKNRNILKIQNQKRQITHKLSQLRTRYRGTSDADAFFSLLQRGSCLPKTIHTYTTGHMNTVKRREKTEHKVNIVGRISRNVCLNIQERHKYCKSIMYMRSRRACTNRARKKCKKFDCENVLRQTKSLSKGTGRSLLQSGYDFDYSALWDEFASNVLTNGECDGKILQDVDVHEDGSFAFECSKAEKLCDCIVGVGETGWEAHFFSPEEEGSALELTVFRDDETGYVAYEIMENGEALAYGNVNEGDAEDATGYRRRRLLQGGVGGGS